MRIAQPRRNDEAAKMKRSGGSRSVAHEARSPEDVSLGVIFLRRGTDEGEERAGQDMKRVLAPATSSISSITRVLAVEAGGGE